MSSLQGQFSKCLAAQLEKREQNIYRVDILEKEAVEMIGSCRSREPSRVSILMFHFILVIFYISQTLYSYRNLPDSIEYIRPGDANVYLDLSQGKYSALIIIHYY